MGDFTIEKGNFTTTQNDIFRAQINGQKLSPETWGLYIFMLSLPDEWDYTIRGLAKVINAGINKIQRILKELEIAGFLKREQTTIGGKFGKMKYTILNTPHNENKETVKNENPPCTRKPYTENEPQQNTNKQSNTDKLMIKGENPPVLKHNNSFHFLTNELINKNFISVLDYDLEKYNNLFKELDNSFSIDLVLTATRYLIDTMIKDNSYYSNKYSYFEQSIYNNLNSIENRKTPKDFNDYLNRLKSLQNQTN